MRRRDFLITTGSLATATLPEFVHAARPCPPPVVSTGSQSVSTACVAASSTYATNFPLTENPIREGGGKWLNGLKDGVVFGDVKTVAGKACAAALITDTLTDAIAIINPSFVNTGNDHFVEATVYVDPTYTPPSSHECELLLRGSVDPAGENHFPLYEINFPWNSTNGQVIYQNGALGGWSEMTDGTSPGFGDGPLVTGDVVRAKIVGNKITVYVNGIVAMTRTDSTITAGQPGIGFFVRTGAGADPTKFCFTSFSCGPAT